MGYSVGFDENWKRDVGYSVPAVCDHPRCDEEIDRGFSFVCGSQMFGGEIGCGLYFCGKHRSMRPTEKDSPMLCLKCCRYEKKPYKPKPDTFEWKMWKLTHESWKDWREENTETVAEFTELKNQYSAEFERLKLKWTGNGDL